MLEIVFKFLMVFCCWQSINKCCHYVARRFGGSASSQFVRMLWQHKLERITHNAQFFLLYASWWWHELCCVNTHKRFSSGNIWKFPSNSQEKHKYSWCCIFNNRSALNEQSSGFSTHVRLGSLSWPQLVRPYLPWKIGSHPPLEKWQSTVSFLNNGSRVASTISFQRVHNQREPHDIHIDV